MYILYIGTHIGTPPQNSEVDFLGTKNSLVDFLGRLFTNFMPVSEKTGIFPEFRGGVPM